MTMLTSGSLPAQIYAPDVKLRVRLVVAGSGSSTIRAKVWLATDPEPAAWQVSAVDSTPSNQGSGAVGLSTYGSTGWPMVQSLSASTTSRSWRPDCWAQARYAWISANRRGGLGFTSLPRRGTRHDSRP